MKKSLLLILLLFIGSFTFAAEDFPAFPMTIYGNIKIGSTNLAGGTLKVYNSSNKELTSYEITQKGKYGSDNVSVQPLLLNKFDGSLTFSVISNGKTYVVDSIDDSKKGSGCPSKSSITFVSENCRYDITLKEKTSSNGGSTGGGSNGGSSSGGSGGGGGGGGSTSKTTTGTTTKTTTGTTTKTTTGNTQNNSITNTGTTVKNNTGNTTNNVGQKVINKAPVGAIKPLVFTYKSFGYSNGNQSDIMPNGFTREMNNAYKFSYANGITTVNNIENAKMYTNLTRIEMAKMLSNYAINILGKQPDYTKGTVKFNDVTNKQDSDYDNAPTLAYQLGIMGQNMPNNNFRPNDEVTRAEFATALSRMLYQTADGQNNYYSTHLAKLQQKGIISDTDPKIKEKRGYVMLMLMRTIY